MSNIKISALNSASTPLSGSEIVPVNQSGVTDSVSVANLTAGRNVATKNATASATLSPWGSGTTGVFEASGGGLNMAMYAASSGLGGITNNFYTIPGTGDFYVANGYATRYYQYAGNHVFQTAPNNVSGAGAAITFTTAFSTDTSGNLTVNANLVQGTAGNGVNFTANTPASGMTSQLLNWYEEGDWTPVIVPQSGTISSQSCSGRYTRIGRVVTIQFSLTVNNVGTAIGISSVTGLPFTSANTASQGSGCAREGYVTGAMWIFTVNQNSTSMSAYQYNNITTLGAYNWIGSLSYTI